MAVAETTEEPRIRKLLIAARAGLEPWVSTPSEKLPEVARQYGAAEVGETIAEMDILSRARADVPAWDGDAHEGIGSAQELWTRILGQVDGALLSDIAEGLKSEQIETRNWVVLAIEMHGEPALSVLWAAREEEPDEGVRGTMDAALKRLLDK